MCFNRHWSSSPSPIPNHVVCIVYAWQSRNNCRQSLIDKSIPALLTLRLGCKWFALIIAGKSVSIPFAQLCSPSTAGQTLSDQCWQWNSTFNLPRMSCHKTLVWLYPLWIGLPLFFFQRRPKVKCKSPKSPWPHQVCFRAPHWQCKFD